MLKRVKEILRKNKLFSAFYNRFLGLNKFRLKRGNLLSISPETFLSRCKVNIHGVGNEIIIHEKSVLKNCTINMFGNNCTLIIKTGCTVYDAMFHFEDTNSKISIGEKTKLTGTISFGAIEGKAIEVGQNCLFSSNIRVVNSDSHSIIDSLGQRCNPAKDVIIGDSVWCGEGVVISKGAIVPTNTVIGTKSLINKVYHKEGTIIAGIPGEVIKERIAWDYKRL